MKPILCSALVLALSAIALCQDVTGTWVGSTVKSLPKDATAQEKKIADKVLQVTAKASPTLTLSARGKGTMVANGYSMPIAWSLKAGIITIKIAGGPSEAKIKVLGRGKDMWLEDVPQKARALTRTTWRRKG